METKINEQGITLIALVITIILLLILAGVVLNLTLGENGIIGKAKIAEETYQNASQKEQQDLEELYSSLMVATNDDAKITLSVAELKTLVQEQANKEIQSALYPTETLIITEFTDTTTEQTYTVPHSGWLYIQSTRNDSSFSTNFYRNDMIIFSFNGAGNKLGMNTTYIPVKEGDIIRKIQNNTGFQFTVTLYY